MERKGTERPEKNTGEMSVTGHLRELRNRLLVCLGALVLCALPGLRYAPGWLEALLRLGEEQDAFRLLQQYSAETAYGLGRETPEGSEGM